MYPKSKQILEVLVFGLDFVRFIHALPLAAAEGHFAQKERRADPAVLPNALAWAAQCRLGAEEHRHQHQDDRSRGASAGARGRVGADRRRVRCPKGRGGVEGSGGRGADC